MTNVKPVDLTKKGISKKFLTYKEAKELYSMGMNKIQEHAKKAGATYKIDGKVLVNCEIFDAYLEQFRVPGDYEAVAKNFIPDMATLYGGK